MNGKVESRWLGTSPCDNERTIALRTNALRAYQGNSSELIPQGLRLRVGTKGYNQMKHNIADHDFFHTSPFEHADRTISTASLSLRDGDACVVPGL